MNIPTILIAALIAVVFAAIVTSGMRKRKRGGTSCSCSCGCGCAGCPSAGLCHPQEQAPDRD